MMPLVRPGSWSADDCELTSSRFPPQTFRVTTAGRLACSACQLVRFDVGAAQAREERGPLGPEMLEEATVQRMRDAPGEEPGGAGVEAAERDGQPVPRERARVPAIAERQRRQEHATHGAWEACGPALGGVQHPEEPAPPLALGVEARRIRPPTSHRAAP